MKNSVFLFGAVLLICCVCVSATEKPLFDNSVVSNNIDFITAEDAFVPSTISFNGIQRQELPDKRRDTLFDDKAFTFSLAFEDKTVVDVYAHSDFKKQANAEKHVEMIARPLGKLPWKMRDTLAHVVIHNGNETAFAEHLGHFFVLYSENMEKRMASNDLEETIFHEAVHATLDHEHLQSAEWKNVQESDVNFITNYAAENPDQEDLAESALFAYTLLKHPGRLPAEVEQWLQKETPNRMAYFYSLFTKIESRPPESSIIDIMKKALTY